MSKLYLPPQVPVASLPSPAVMDIRPLLALASDKVEREDASAAQPAVKDIRRRRRRLLEIDEHYKHAKILLCICESSTKKERK